MMSETKLTLSRKGDGVYEIKPLGITVTRTKRPTPGGPVTEWEAERNDCVAHFDALSDVRKWLEGLT